jgi:hypothetical protein
MSSEFPRRWVTSSASIKSDGINDYCEYCSEIQPTDRKEGKSLHESDCRVLDADYLTLHGAGDFTQYIINSDPKKNKKLTDYPDIGWLDLVEEYLHGDHRIDQIVLGWGFSHTLIVQDYYMKDVHTSTLEDCEKLINLFLLRLPLELKIVVREKDGHEIEFQGENDSKIAWQSAFHSYSLYRKQQREIFSREFGLKSSPHLTGRTSAAFQEHLKSSNRTEILLNYRLSKMKPGYLRVGSKNRISSLSKSDYERETRREKIEMPLEDGLSAFFGEGSSEVFRPSWAQPNGQDALTSVFRDTSRYFFLSESGKLTELENENWY